MNKKANIIQYGEEVFELPKSTNMITVFFREYGDAMWKVFDKNGIRVGILEKNFNKVAE